MFSVKKFRENIGKIGFIVNPDVGAISGVSIMFVASKFDSGRWRVQVCCKSEDVRRRVPLDLTGIASSPDKERRLLAMI